MKINSNPGPKSAIAQPSVSSIGTTAKEAESSDAPLIDDAAKAAAAPAPTLKLLEVAAANGAFVKFGEAVEKAGLSDTLRGDGPFTVFAPTDNAFARLPAGRLDELFDPANKAELVSLVNYHILKGRRSLADVGKWQSARTIQGQAAPVTLEGNDIRIDGARVLYADIPSTNGFIHGIDALMTPVAAATLTRPASAS